MKLISDIINELLDERISLTVPLNKTKILATRIVNQPLLNWVNFELKGYPDKELLPPYRKTQGTILGNFINGRHQVINYPLPLPEFGEGMDEEMRTFYLFDGIATIEHFAISKREESLISRFPDGLKRSIENILQNTNGPYFQLLQVGVSVPIHVAAHVITAVKDKLLEFMLELEKEFGLETEIDDLKKNNAKINYIMGTTINNNGDGNVINTGHKANVKANIHLTKGGKAELQKTLTENDVAESDITELLNVIDTEIPFNGNFGSKVNSWIQKMIAKSLDGSWQISIGAAGTLLAEALHKYYGL